MNYEEMSDFEINKAVAGYLPNDWYWMDYMVYLDIYHTEVFDPCSNPSDAWPVMLDNNIFIAPTRDNFEFKYMTKCLINGSIGLAWTSRFTSYSDNPLRAAMICFLKMKDAE